MDHGRREMKRRSITIAVIVTLIVLPCGFLVGLTVTLYERAERPAKPMHSEISKQWSVNTMGECLNTKSDTQLE